MARIPLGALSTLNTGTHLDPMFVELYAAWSGGFTQTQTLTVGAGTGVAAMVVDGANAAAGGGCLIGRRAGANSFILGDAGAVLGGTETSDTVLYSSGTNKQRFYTNGAERMRIDASGNVGIGAAPSEALSVVRATVASVAVRSGAGAAAYLSADGTAGYVGTLSAHPLYVQTAGSLRLAIDTSGHVSTGVDNAQTLGTSSKRWSVVHAGTGSINTSDAREKTAVRGLLPPEVEAAKALAREIGGFRFLASITEKGDDARLHVGMTVQRAIQIMESHGLDPMAYAFICYDEWPETEDAPSGSRYGFRVDQLLLFIARGFEARLDALERAAA